MNVYGMAATVAGNPSIGWEHQNATSKIKSGVANMADYKIDPDGRVIKLLSERSTQRASGTVHPKVGARIVFRTKHDTAEFVRAGESEGFTFEGKEFLEGQLEK